MGTTRTIYSPRPDRTRTSPEKKETTPTHENAIDSFGVVYVNNLARHALMEEKNPRFPVGSVIVREKLTKVGDSKAQMLVVMVKREKGFNSKARDWEFLMTDGEMSKVLRREKTGGCRDCHEQQKKQDFVFRLYMSEDERAMLK